MVLVSKQLNKDVRTINDQGFGHLAMEKSTKMSWMKHKSNKERKTRNRLREMFNSAIKTKVSDRTHCAL